MSDHNQGFIFAGVIIGIYNTGKLDKEMFDEAFKALAEFSIDADFGDAYELETKDGLNFFELICKYYKQEEFKKAQKIDRSTDEGIDEYQETMYDAYSETMDLFGVD